MFEFRRITLFCLEKRLSKHKMTIFSKKFWLLWPPLATPMTTDDYYITHTVCTFKTMYCTMHAAGTTLNLRFIWWQLIC